MTNQTFWALLVLAGVLSLAIGIVVSTANGWLLGVITYFVIDIVLGSAIVSWASREK